jgi:membrane protein DedA with SNARE-associated domain
VAGVSGNVFGTTVLFTIGRRVGYAWLPRLKRRLESGVGLRRRLSRVIPGEALLLYFENLFHQRGGFFWVGCLRCFPWIRSIVSLPAGMVRMNTGAFLLFTTVGCTIWAGAWLSMGLLIGESWSRWSPTITGTLIAVLFIILLILKSRLKTALDLKVLTGDPVSRKEKDS